MLEQATINVHATMDQNNHASQMTTRLRDGIHALEFTTTKRKSKRANGPWFRLTALGNTATKELEQRKRGRRGF